VVERVDKLNTHFGQARKDLEEITTAAERAGKRATRIDAFEFEEEDAGVLPLAEKGLT
jgi:DNA recombination protein RmuC